MDSESPFKFDDEAEEKEDDAKEEDVAEMKEALETMVTEDKHAKLDKFVEREDDIREITDKASSDVIEPHPFGEEAQAETDASKEQGAGKKEEQAIDASEATEEESAADDAAATPTDKL